MIAYLLRNDAKEYLEQFMSINLFMFKIQLALVQKNV